MIFSHSKTRSIWDIFAELHVLKMYQYHKVNVKSQTTCCWLNSTGVGLKWWNRRVAEIQIFEKTYLIVIKDETGPKFKMNDSTLFLIGSYAQKLVASY